MQKRKTLLIAILLTLLALGIGGNSRSVLADPIIPPILPPPHG